MHAGLAKMLFSAVMPGCWKKTDAVVIVLMTLMKDGGLNEGG